MATALSTVEVLDRLVSFDTTSRNSNLPLLDWVEEYLKGFGVSGERVYDETGQKANLWVTIGPKDVPGYVLSPAMSTWCRWTGRTGPPTRSSWSRRTGATMAAAPAT